MNPQYIRHNEIDFTKWDHCVQSCENHLPYCYSWYLNTVSPGWDALVFGNYEKIFPLTGKAKAQIHYLYQPYFTQQLGVFGNNLTEQDTPVFLQAIPEKFKFIEINLNTQNQFFSAEISSKNKTTYHIDLKNKYDEIYLQFNTNTKRNIKKAESHNLKLNKAENTNILIQLFKENAGKKTDLTNKNYKTLEKLIHECTENNIGHVYEVHSNENKIESAAFIISSKNILINLFNAVSPTGKKNGAMFFLFNEIIKANSVSNKYFDFEGSDIPEVARFYQGFGAKPALYQHIKLNRLPWPLNFFKK